MLEYYIEIKWNVIENKNNGIIYANLRDNKDAIIISADLSYILKSALERNYHIKNLQHQMMHLANTYDLRAIKRI